MTRHCRTWSQKTNFWSSLPISQVPALTSRGKTTEDTYTVPSPNSILPSEV